MNSYIYVSRKHPFELPERFINDDVRSSEDLVSALIDECTEAEDVVFDPFVGYGTSLIVSER